MATASVGKHDDTPLDVRTERVEGGTQEEGGGIDSGLRYREVPQSHRESAGLKSDESSLKLGIARFDERR